MGQLEGSATATSLRRAPWTLLLAAAAAAQVAVFATWARQVTRTYGVDFDTHYAAGKLLVTGHRDTMYSLPHQVAALNASGGSIGGVNHAAWGPVALLTVLPFTYLALPVAVVLWTALQGAALTAAAWLTVHNDRGIDPANRRLLFAVAVAAPGAAELLVLGQWEGIAALLVGLAWLDTWRGRRWRSAAWLVLLAGALPQLVAGLAVFQVALWGWRHAVRLACGGALLAAVSLLVLGPSGVSGWLGQVADLARSVRPADTDGFYGLVSGVLGGAGPAATAVTGVAIAAALAVCAWLGHRHRDARIAAATALGITGLSLLVSPHLFQYSIVVLVPLAVLTLIAEVRRSSVRWPGVLLLWVALSLLSVAGIHSGSVWWNPVIPLTLLAMVVLALETRRTSATPRRLASG